MINIPEEILRGVLAGLGMTVVMTVFGFLTFKLTKNWITKTISEIWAKVKSEGLKLDGIQIEGKLETKRRKNNK